MSKQRSEKLKKNVTCNVSALLRDRKNANIEYTVLCEKCSPAVLVLKCDDGMILF